MPLIAAAVLAGACFSLISVGYFLANRRGISVILVSGFMFLAGALYFGLTSAHPAVTSAPAVYALGAAAGLVTALVSWFIQRAVSQGLLSGMWIAANLNFVPQAILCRWLFGEPLSVFKLIGLATGVSCIFILAAHKKAPPSAQPAATRGLSRYAVMVLTLTGLLLTNSLAVLFMKYLSYQPVPTGGNLWDLGGGTFNMLLYGGALVFALPHILTRCDIRAKFGSAILPGLFASTGSISGVAIMSWCIARHMPGTLSFPIISIISILTGSLLAVLAFNEERKPSWYAGTGLALASVILFML